MTNLIRPTAIFASLTTLVTAAVIVLNPLSVASSAEASSVGYLNQISRVDVAGLVIKYRDGVSPLAPNGEITGANFAGVQLRAGHGLGLNMYSVKFANKLSKIQIATVMANLARSPKIALVAPDQVLKFSSAAYVAPKTVSPKSTPKSASAVRKLTAVDAWSKKTPKLARLSLTWAKPLKLYGAKLMGYQVQLSADEGKTFNAVVEKTKANVLKYSVTKDLYAGISYRFRVRAITKLNLKSSYGRFSSVAKASPTSVPQAPVFESGDTVTGTQAPAWLSQSANQRGGLPVKYLVTASAEGSPDVTCRPTVATENTCTLVGLNPAKTYRTKVRATNTHGSAQSRPTQTVTDPKLSQQWYLTGKFGINAPSGWAYNEGSYQAGATLNRVTVAVLDTGYTAHPDLDNQYVKENGQVYGYDFVTNHTPDSQSPEPISVATNDSDGWDPDPADPGDYVSTTPPTVKNKDSSWHGTHIAGLIAAQANNGIGITGVAPQAQILPVRVLGPENGLSSDLAAAITWAIGLPVPQFAVERAYTTAPPVNLHPAQVINISMGTSATNGCDSATQAAIEAARALKVTIVTSAGNSLKQAFTSYPGNCYGTINVGATSSLGDRAVYSNSGPGVDVSAPGGDSTQPTGTDAESAGMLLSTFNTGLQGPLAPSYGNEEGTSMAAPLVSGVVALMYAAHPSISFEQAASIIINTATPFNNDPSQTFKSPSSATNNQLNLLGHCYNPRISDLAPNFDNDGRCGSGIVNAGAAVAAAAALP